jgi:hypothetical protein
LALAGGGAIFLRDPHGLVGEDQLNGGMFTAMSPAHWALMRPMLLENERLFGLSIERLLRVEGEQREPEDVYRAIIPVKTKALQPEEAYVRQKNTPLMLTRLLI